jgi:nitrate reductase molybdenum cofactor assembly chaperone NarJ/NarW
MKLLKLIAVLLDYPQDDLWNHGDELREGADDPASR